MTAKPETEPGMSLVPTESRAPLPTIVETAATAVAAQAKAAVEARYLMALRQPRNWDEVRVRILAACKRPRFAETARYSKPVGRTAVQGPSIRFAEEALRGMGNVLVDSAVVFDDDERRIVRVSVTDLEANVTYPLDILLSKTVERKQPREGQEVLAKRVNSAGDQVYIVRATEDELLIKQAALTSKAIRSGGLRILPSDILEEAMELVVETLKDRDAKDPTNARKRVIDLFYALGVGPEDLAAFLGHKLEQMTNAELNQLREIYNAIKEGEASWAQVMEVAMGTTSEELKARTKQRAEALKEKLGVGKKAPAAESKGEQQAPVQDDADVRREELELVAQETKGGKSKREAGED